MTVESEFCTREEAAELLFVQPSTMAVWAAEGTHLDTLPCGRIGRRVYYRRADVLAFRASRIPAAVTVTAEKPSTIELDVPVTAGKPRMLNVTTKRRRTTAVMAD